MTFRTNYLEPDEPPLNTYTNLPYGMTLLGDHLQKLGVDDLVVTAIIDGEPHVFEMRKVGAKDVEVGAVGVAEAKPQKLGVIRADVSVDDGGISLGWYTRGGGETHPFYFAEADAYSIAELLTKADGHTWVPGIPQAGHGYYSDTEEVD